MTSIPTLGPGAFRLILAILVLISHLSSYNVGQPAVYVFFMLSGYWVTKMYAEKYRPSVSLSVFYLSRLMRIWLPFAVVFVTVFTLYHFLLPEDSARPMSYLWGLAIFGVASSKLDVLGTSWSLDIELQFYLLVPLIFLTLRRASWLAIFLGTGALTCAGWVLQTGYGVVTVISYLPPFIAGAMIWACDINRSGRSALFAVFVFIVIGVFMWFVPSLRPLLLTTLISPFPVEWVGILWTLVLIPLVNWNVKQRSGALDMHFGGLSFMLYIVHFPVITIMVEVLAPVSALDKLVLCGLSLLIAIAAYLLVDRPSERLRAAVIRRLVL